jgi:PKD repeat protein
MGNPVVRMKPEITAVDGVDTTFFFSDPDGDGTDNFFGTSAAAPHAAGIAALMLQAKSGSTPQQINAALEASAINMNTPGFDHDSGYGLIQADAAIASLLAAGGNNPPTAGFTSSIADLVVTFTDMSTDTDGSIMTRSWNFGDGGISSAQNPSHTYAAGGSYMVALTVTDDNGGMNSSSQQVTVSAGGGGTAAPIANFSYACNRRDCLFTSTSSADAGISSYLWKFGDGSESIEAVVSHTYTSNGNYTVTLVVTDGVLTSDPASASFRVKNRGNTTGSTGGDTGGDTGGTTGGSEKGRKKCNDGIDNDGDGLIDGADPDC